MKKSVFFAFILLTLSSLFAIGEKDIVQISLTPSFELLNGHLNEYVFDNSCKNIDNKESELIWDIENIPLLNIKGNVTLFKYAFVGVNFKLGIPKPSGQMQDYDWLNSVTPNWINDDPYELTNYSCHTNILKNFTSFTAKLGGNIITPVNLIISPFLAYQYEYMAFDGNDGFKKYKSDDYKVKYFNEDLVDNKKVTGTLITYSQEISTFFLGLALDYTPFKFVSIDSSFMISPKLSFISAIDKHSHPQKLVAFGDTISNVFQFSADSSIFYVFNEHHKLGLSGFINYIPISKGVDYSREIDKEGNYTRNSKWKKESVLGGTSRFLWSIGISYKFSI